MMTINAIIKIIIVLSMFYDEAVQYCPQPPAADALDGGCDAAANGGQGGGGGGNNNNGGGGNQNNGGGGNNNSNKPEQQDEDYKGCGQYGFRCIDLKSFQICPGPPLDDEYSVKEEPQEHACGEGLICDEDNPAYCSPMEASMTTPRQDKKEGPLQNWVEDVYFNDYMERIQKLSDYNDEYSLRVVRSSDDERRHSDDCGCSTFPTTEMSTVMTTTLMTTPEVVSSMNGPYECEGYGFHADTGNNTLFWYCDVPESGVGYIIKHMSCGEDRIFDSSLNTCVKIGTTRNIRNGPDDGNIVEHRCAPSTPPPQTPFSCKNFPPGKYKDDNDCSLYHICFSNKYFPLKEVTISCPHNMAFDAFMKKCTHKNGKRCSKPTACPLPTPCPKPTTTKCPKSTTKCTKKPTTTKCSTTSAPCTADPPCSSSTPCSSCGLTAINCETPIRFRDVSDCSGYFLCYSDNVIHMNCPESFRFDDSYHDCMPDRIARCTEEI